MKALQFSGKKLIEFSEFPDPEPGDNEVVIDIKASSLCRSDMSLYYGSSVLEKDDSSFVIPGHEPAGVVSKIGKNVTSDTLKTGDRVAIYLAVSCGHCKYCYEGNLMYCATWKCIGFHINGGHAEKMLIPAKNCLKIPDAMSFEEAALSTDKFGTLYHAQKRLGVSARDKVAVFGMGPMGLIGVAIAHALGAEVIAVDLLEERLNLAREVGADHIINSKTSPPVEKINEITCGNGCDVGIDCSGNETAQNQMLDSLKKDGQGCFIGESSKSYINPSNQFIRKQLTVIGSWYFPIWEYAEIVDFILRKKIHLKKLITHTFKLKDGKEAFDIFDQGKTGIVIFTN